jgi:hypothetical protein
VKIAIEKSHENYETGIPTPLVSCTGRCVISNIFNTLATIAAATLATGAAIAVASETEEQRQARLLRNAQIEARRLEGENRRLKAERRMMQENPVARLLRDLTVAQDESILDYDNAAACLGQVPRLNRADVLKEYVRGNCVSKATALRLVSLLPRYDRRSTMSWIARQ